MDAVLRLHRKWLSNPSEGCQADLRGTTIDYQSYIGEDLRSLLASGVSFREARFYDVDLSGGVFDGAEFCHARAHHSNLRDVAAREANFTGAHLNHCDLSGAKLTSATFFRADINGCIFRNADLEGCDLREVRMRGADLRGANLRGTLGLTPAQINQAITDESTMLP
jgi:uncharacterized protein YjbI with pentapeptide repeats